ncbi:MAG: ATP synthase F1 subunit delta [Planctomycetes bacterium TMED75]|nr:ATP synthase F1 subunit delta [Planctomycetaceae bacterium]OUU92111.1 MAG: ATP synthase F1 subunit delta [Planctomycetes bacterium TMED75]
MPQQYDEVAGVYARSLYELAHEAGGLDKVEEIYGELEAVVEIARADPRFKEFLSSPILGKGARQQTLRSVFENRISDMLLRFLLVANDKGRLGELEHIASALDAMLQEAHGRIEVDVYTASDDQLDEELLATVRGKVQAATGKEPVLHHYSDPDMIGGIKLLIGDQLIDGSVATRLRRMREGILGAGSSGLRAESANFLEEDS